MEKESAEFIASSINEQIAHRLKGFKTVGYSFKMFTTEGGVFEFSGGVNIASVAHKGKKRNNAEERASL